MKALLLVICFLSIAACTYAQSDFEKELIKDVQLRQTFQTTDGKYAPAQFQLTFPNDAKASYLIDAGLAVKLNFLKLHSITSYVTAEYHRNTLINEQQNNYQFGYHLRWFERADNLSKLFRNVITGNLKYVRDQVDLTNALAATANWTLYSKRRTGLQLNRPGYMSGSGNPYRYTYNLTPYAGAEYVQTLNHTENNVGTAVRVVGNVSGAFAINKPYNTANGIRQPQKSLELFADFTTRYAVINKINDERYTRLLRSGINYYFIDIEKLSVSLGGNYNLGSDPLNGLKNQQYWQIALQIQI